MAAAHACGEQEVGYGTGLQVIRTPCGDVIGHDGGIPGFATMALATADGRRVFALVINQYFPGGALSQAFSEVVGALMVQLFPGCAAAPSISVSAGLAVASPTAPGPKRQGADGWRAGPRGGRTA